ncbi:replication protein P [Escherichia coli]|uniref:replication protein P n=1 Tax=Escherichia coli TaxID=562 RepID=UPI000907224B|nr:replication protein P [Escherichia coli]
MYSGQLLATFPASLANRDQNELKRNPPPVGSGFPENGITTMEQVSAGMRVARRQNRPFLPSPGQFVAWCREEASVNAGLPNVSELVDMVYEYCRKRGPVSGCRVLSVEIERALRVGYQPVPEHAGQCAD